MFSINATGLDDLRARLAAARAQVTPLVEAAVQREGDLMMQALTDAAPRGKSEGPPPPGDGDGPLAESFYVQQESPPSSSGAAISVKTTQPTKLKYVREGTGIYGPRGQRIVPTTRQALMWPGAAHPVKSVAGQQPNDFVTPVIENAPDSAEVLDGVIAELIAILNA